MSGQVCVNGCHSARTMDDGTIRRIPRLAAVGYVCEPCRNRLAGWLSASGIPEDYGWLWYVATPGSVHTAPGSKKGKGGKTPPIPVRVDVLDLVDDRLGLRTDGSTDKRGTLGLLESWARLVREERRIAPPRTPSTIVNECAFLHRQVDWLCGRPWIDEMYREIRALARDLSTAIGYPWPKPLPCPDCGQPVWLPTNGADIIRCSHCSAYWTKDRWLHLATVVESEAS